MPTTITKVIEWDMGHRVPDHKSKCRNLHGHRYRLELTVGGYVVDKPNRSDTGMVFDFGDIKKAMAEKVHDVLDHKLMIFNSDKKLLDVFKFQDTEFEKAVILAPFIPTAEKIAEWCYRQLENSFPKGVKIINVRLFETPNSWADYKK